MAGLKWRSPSDVEGPHQVLLASVGQVFAGELADLTFNLKTWQLLRGHMQGTWLTAVKSVKSKASQPIRCL